MNSPHNIELRNSACRDDEGVLARLTSPESSLVSDGNLDANDLEMPDVSDPGDDLNNENEHHLIALDDTNNNNSKLETVRRADGRSNPGGGNHSETSGVSREG